MVAGWAGSDAGVRCGGAGASPGDQGGAAPASATAAPTRKALCIPAVKVAWLIWVMTPAACAGVLWVTGATPTETALLTWA